MKLNENPYGLQFLIFNIDFDDDKLPMSLINTESMLTKSEGGPYNTIDRSSHGLLNADCP